MRIQPTVLESLGWKSEAYKGEYTYTKVIKEEGNFLKERIVHNPLCHGKGNWALTITDPDYAQEHIIGLFVIGRFRVSDIEHVERAEKLAILWAKEKTVAPRLCTEIENQGWNGTSIYKNERWTKTFLDKFNMLATRVNGLWNVELCNMGDIQITSFRTMKSLGAAIDLFLSVECSIETRMI